MKKGREGETNKEMHRGLNATGWTLHKEKERRSEKSAVECMDQIKEVAIRRNKKEFWGKKGRREIREVRVEISAGERIGQRESVRPVKCQGGREGGTR